MIILLSLIPPLDRTYRRDLYTTNCERMVFYIYLKTKFCMSIPKKRYFKIVAFKHKVEPDLKYAEKTWNLLENTIRPSK